MPVPITASVLYDLIQCLHRVSMDLFADPVRRDPVNPFVQLLWERGNLYEREVISGLDTPFLDLSIYGGDEKERLTREAMARGEPLIYGGRLHAGELLGDPDLLRLEGTGYIPGDIKSGEGEESDEDDSRLKIWWERSRVGSIPTLGTNQIKGLQQRGPFFFLIPLSPCPKFVSLQATIRGLASFLTYSARCSRAARRASIKRLGTHPTR